MQPRAFKEFFEHQLNPQQQEAVVTTQGSLLIIAGAGSGKTRVITSRIVNLIINEQVAPASIVALTFTNKAAAEMKERITHFLGAQATKIYIGTFHSYCLYLLRTYNHLTQFQEFSILDADDQQQLLQSLIKRHALQKKVTAKNVSYQISLRKNSIIPFDQFHVDPVFESLYQAYENEKNASKALDFDDLLLEVLKLFSHNSAFKILFQNKIRHILVDEYQDTNTVQHALLKQMALNNNEFVIDSLCAVGDEDQSIYSWRGATVANIMHFKQDFPQTKLIKIEQNYRSVEPILTIANEVIKNNSQRNPKNLWSTRQANNRACMLNCLSDYQEGETIAAAIKSAHTFNKVSSIAVLYRAHYLSRVIEESLLRNSISYKIIGGIQFYERKEIKDMLAYLRLMVNPFDRIAFLRIINTPSRGLGEKFEADVQTLWEKEPLLDFHGLIHRMIKEQIVTGKKAESLKEFGRIFQNQDHQQKPTSALNHIIFYTEYFTYLKDSFDPKEAESKIENVKELLRAAKHFEEQKSPHLNSFLYDIALMQEKIKNQDEAEEPVYLMTLHGAKGLEFDTVILSSLEEGVFPSNPSLLIPDGVEEERRLFYVGITRAKEHLIITNARYRYSYGSMLNQRPSRFLNEIPEQLIKKENVTQWSSYELTQWFAQWWHNKPYNTMPTTSVYTYKTAHKAKKEISHVLKKTTTTVSSYSTTPSTLTTINGFKKFQSVRHEKFGIGIVEQLEKKDETTLYITAKFKSGTKKIKSDFLSPV